MGMACFWAALLGLYTAQLAAILFLEHRRQAHMAAWLLIVLICPFIGFGVYWLLGRKPVKNPFSIEKNKSVEDELEKTGCDDGNQWELAVDTNTEKDFTRILGERVVLSPHTQFTRLHALLKRDEFFAVTNQNKTRILTDGEETYKTMLEEMAKAKHHIHLDYYTIRSDATGQLFMELLIRKAKQGIMVKLIYDGIGSMKLKRAFLESMEAGGCRTACFAPLRQSLAKRRLNFRNHRKIVVIDGIKGFLGGINIGDEYIGMDPKLGYWRDTHLKIEGDGVGELQKLFMEDWVAATGEQLNGQSPHYFPGHQIADHEKLLIVSSEPGVTERKMVEILQAIMSAAAKRIYASTPYFIPDPIIASELASAARSGVEVKLILPGISDSKLVLLATMSHVQDMLDAGVNIYRYRKGFIHAKVLIVDNTVASVGSANLDQRSLYSNYELLALLFAEKPIAKLLKDFEADLSHSEKLSADAFRDRPWKQKAAEAIMHILSPLL
ncbi:cardiolipin synthase [Paenibacillus sp. CAU 1782]